MSFISRHTGVWGGSSSSSVMIKKHINRMNIKIDPANLLKTYSIKHHSSGPHCLGFKHPTCPCFSKTKWQPSTVLSKVKSVSSELQSSLKVMVWKASKEFLTVHLEDPLYLIAIPEVFNLGWSIMWYIESSWCPTVKHLSLVFLIAAAGGPQDRCKFAPILKTTSVSPTLNL